MKKFRIYLDGSIIEEDEFEEWEDPFEDYEEYCIPTELVDYLTEKGVWEGM